MIIIGAATSDPATRLGSYHTAKARVELAAVETTSKKVAGTASGYGVATDLSRFVAEKRAIEDATERLSPSLISEVAASIANVGEE